MKIKVKIIRRIVIGALENKMGILALLFMLPYLAIGCNQGIYIYDEGVFIYGAARVLSGDLPYRDFWTLHAPAQFYVLAGLFKIFGASIMTARVSSVLILFLLSAIVYLVARCIMPQSYALLVYLLWTMRAGAYRGFAANDVQPALLFSLLSVLCVFHYFSTRRTLSLVMAGFSAGLATTFRQDFGLYTAITEAGLLGLFVLTKATDGSRPIRAWLKVGSATVWYGLGLVTVVGPIGLYFTAKVGARELAHDLVLFPLTVYPHVYTLPFPPLVSSAFSVGSTPTKALESFLIGFPFYLPLVIYPLVAALLAIGSWKGRVDWAQREVWAETLLLVLGVAFLNQLQRRPDGAHLFPTLIPTVVLFGALVSRIAKCQKRRTILTALAVGVSVAFVARPVVFQAGTAIDTLRARPFSFGVQRAKGIAWDSRGLNYQRAIEYVQQTVPPGERLFVGNTRHDIIGVNDALFYFLAERPSATRYHELARGLATTARVQREIVDELERARLRWIVLRRELRYEPNSGGSERGADILDQYIREHFRPTAMFGNYSVWTRAGSCKIEWPPSDSS